MTLSRRRIWETYPRANSGRSSALPVRRRIEQAVMASGLALLADGTAVTTAPPAHAAFAGVNGSIAFASSRANGGSYGGIFQFNSRHPDWERPAVTSRRLQG